MDQCEASVLFARTATDVLSGYDARRLRPVYECIARLGPPVEAASLTLRSFVYAFRLRVIAPEVPEEITKSCAAILGLGMFVGLADW